MTHLEVDLLETEVGTPLQIYLRIFAPVYFQAETPTLTKRVPCTELNYQRTRKRTLLELSRRIPLPT